MILRFNKSYHITPRLDDSSEVRLNNLKNLSVIITGRDLQSLMTITQTEVQFSHSDCIKIILNIDADSNAQLNLV